MTSHIGRRKFLATLGGAAAAWPLAAGAQQAAKQPTKLPTIGYLGDYQFIFPAMGRVNPTGQVA